MVQWMDVNQLSQEENLHSKCLCINRLPLDLSDSEELAQFFSETYKPVFCQVSALDTYSSSLEVEVFFFLLAGRDTKPFVFYTLAGPGLHRTKDLSGCGSLNVGAVKSHFKRMNSLRAQR